MSGDWMYGTPYNIGQPGSTVRANGGAGAQALGFRDVLDARRTMQGIRAPQAEYPDGYLGTINSRREDRLLQHVQGRLTQRSYQRGVHKGERMDPSSYYWTDDVNPQLGIAYEARGGKFTQRGNSVERLAHGGKYEFASPAEIAGLYQQYGGDPAKAQSAEIDPVRQERLRRMLPGWR